MRPVLPWAAGKWMDCNKPLIVSRAGDRRNCSLTPADLTHVEIRGMHVCRGRQRLQKAERKTANRVSELRTIRAVPGNDLVEPFECSQPGRVCIDTRGKD